MMMMMTTHSGKVLQHKANPQTKETPTRTKEPNLTLGAYQLCTNVGISSPDPASYILHRGKEYCELLIRRRKTNKTPFIISRCGPIVGRIRQTPKASPRVSARKKTRPRQPNLRHSYIDLPPAQHRLAVTLQKTAHIHHEILYFALSCPTRPAHKMSTSPPSQIKSGRSSATWQSAGNHTM